jgi:hypothetical protein
MKSLNYLSFSLCLFGLFFGAAFSQTKQIEVLEPATYEADFESGSVGSWSSYPAAQDTAYDPSIWVKRIEGNPSRSLAREISPYSENEYTFGVRKKLGIYLNRESRISFRYYLKSYRRAQGLIVRLGFGDGTSTDIALAVDPALKWSETALSLAGYFKGDEIKPLEAVAIMAVCPKADPETKLRLAIDDLKITGLREKKIIVEKPAVHELEELGVSVASEHFQAGQDVRIEARFPVPLREASVRISQVWKSAGAETIGMKKSRDAYWAAVIQTKVRTPGLWRAEVSGKTPAGGSLRSEIYFLIKPAATLPEHPYLLVDQAGIKNIREAVMSGHPAEVWQKVQQGAATFRQKFNPADFRYNLDAYDEVFWLPTYEGYVRALHTPSQFIRENSIVYAISGDRTAGAAARQALLQIAAWPSFVHPHILNQGQFTYWPVGLALIDFAVGFDFVYNLLSPAERQTIADALYNKGVTEVFKEYVRDDRVSSNTSNWISHVTGGGILCALAIQREYPGTRLEPYLTGMMVKLGEFIFSTFDPDGYYGEGYYYHNFAMQSLSHTLPALEKSFGIAPPEDVLNSFEYILYQQDNQTGRIYEFGDAHDDLIPSSMSNFAYALSRQVNPYLRWLYEQRPGGNYLDVLFPSAPGVSKPPQDLPLTKRLRKVGTTILRTGFAHEDFVFVFKCGPFFNHQHFDQGSFFLADRGEVFIEECGNSNYYEDPWYPRLYIQAGGHNCLLDDANIESQQAGDFLHDVRAWQDFARTDEFLEWKEGAFISADLTPVYRKKWQSLRRNVLYLRPRLILIHDTGEGASDTQTLRLRLHAPRKEDIRLDGRTATIVRNQKSLAIRTLFPERFQSEVLKRPMSLNEFKAENPITMKARGFLELSTAVENGRAAFLNVLGTDSEAVSKCSAADRSTYLEVSIAASIYYLGKADGQSYRVDGLETDARIFSRRPDGYLAAGVCVVKYPGLPGLRSDQRASFLIKTGERQIEVGYSTSRPTRLEVSIGRRPKAVRLNGKALAEWSYGEGNVALTLAAAEGTIEFIF